MENYTEETQKDQYIDDCICPAGVHHRASNRISSIFAGLTAVAILVILRGVLSAVSHTMIALGRLPWESIGNGLLAIVVSVLTFVAIGLGGIKIYTDWRYHKLLPWFIRVPLSLSNYTAELATLSFEQVRDRVISTAYTRDLRKTLPTYLEKYGDSVGTLTFEGLIEQMREEHSDDYIVTDPKNLEIYELALEVELLRLKQQA